MEPDLDTTEPQTYDGLPVVKLKGLSHQEYEHPFDREAIQVLANTPGLPEVIKKLNEHSLDRYWRVQYTGSYFKVSKESCPDLDSMLTYVCQVLDVEQVPDLYIMPDYSVNALTYGVTRPLICLTTGCLDLLTRQELLYLLGHEVGHIKSQHVMYLQVASAASLIGEVIGAVTLGIGNIVGSGLQAALLTWSRKAEFTADRAGLLACQDLSSATTALMKIAGFPPIYYTKINYEHFLQQAKDFESIDEGNDRFWKAASIIFAAHPWTVMRAAELQNWIRSGYYMDVIERKTYVPAAAQWRVFCTNCGNKLVTGDRFCRKCGSQVS